MVIPIFIITHDRLEVLKTCFESMKKLSDKVEYQIIFVDNNSTYQPLINWLKEKDKEGYLVYWNNTKNLFEGIQQGVNRWYKDNDSPYYVITDPDIEMICPEDILEYYVHIFEKYQKAQVVAPLLRTDDIPNWYPAKDKVLRNIHNNYGKQQRFEIEWKNNKYKAIYAGVGCTFAMYRKGFVKKKDTSNKCPVISIRTEKPYYVKHLDWYLDPKKLTEDQKRYCNKSEIHTHWSTKHIKRFVI